MNDLYSKLQQYEKGEARKFPTSGTIARIDGTVVDVSIGTAILRNVRVVGSPSSVGQVVVLTWENGVPTAHMTDGSMPSSVALIRGPQGPQGEQGLTGPTGAQGPAGETGSMASSSFGELIEQSSAPAAPGAGSLRFYAKTDHKIYKRQSDGTETEIGTGGGSSFATNETPTGLVNGSNTLFTFPEAYVPGTLQLFRDGQLLTPGGADYSETNPAAGTVTFVTAPATGSVILGSYQISVASTGNADLLDGYHASSFALNTLLADYMKGLKLVRVSGTGLTVTTGAAYIPGLTSVLQVPSNIFKTGLSLSVSTWYHVYLCSNGGTPDIELSATAPAVYQGGARQKTGDTSRRYLGSVKTDGSANLLNFIHYPDLGLMHYLQTQDLSPFRVLSGGTAVTETSVSCSAVVPVTSQLIKIKVSNTDSSRRIAIGNSLDSVDMTVADAGIYVINSLNFPLFELPLDGSQAFTYRLNAATTGGAAYVDVYGYYFER
jgi:hypothetical protein